MIEIEYMPIENILISGINPASRTKISSKDDLLISMRENGFIPYYPILLSNDGMVGDGHRRLKCAEILGIKSVPVIRTNKSTAELIAGNAGEKPFNISNWDSVASSGVIPSGTAKKLRNALVNLCGNEAIDVISKYGFSSRISQALGMLSRYIGKTDDKNFNLNALIWMCENHMQRRVIEAIRDGISPELLLEAIQNHKLIQRGNWISS